MGGVFVTEKNGKAKIWAGWQQRPDWDGAFWEWQGNRKRPGAHDTLEASPILLEGDLSSAGMAVGSSDFQIGIDKPRELER